MNRVSNSDDTRRRSSSSQRDCAFHLARPYWLAQRMRSGGRLHL